MLNFIRATGSRSKSVFIALLFGFLAISIYAVNAAFTRTDNIRLSPVQVTVTPDSGLPADVKDLEKQTSALAFDRDTSTEYVAYGQSLIELSFDKAHEIHTLKVFGAAPYDISVKALLNGQWQDVDGLYDLDLSSLTPFWHSYQVTDPVTTDQLQISFKSSTGGQASGLKELEIWGQEERVTVNTGINLLDSIENNNAAPQARLYKAAQTEAIIGNVEGLDDQSSDNSFSISLDRDPRSIKRAWLSYESHAAGHWVSVIRDVNGLGDLGGSYRFASTAWSGQLEQINPHWLVQGSNTVTFKVIEDNSYRIRNLGLLLELDDGSNYIESISAYPVSDSNTSLAAHDGNNLSGWAPYDGPAPNKAKRYLQLDFDKQVQLEGIALNLNNSLSGKIEVEFLENGEWANAGIGAILGKDLIEGWNNIAVDRKVFISGMKLVFENGNGSKAEIIEVAPVGSGVNATQSPERIDVIYPDAGQYHGDAAYIRGFVQPMDNGSGAAQVFVAGKDVTRTDTAFEALVNQSDFTEEDNGYSVLVEAIYPDNRKVTKKVYLTDALDAANDLMQTYGVDETESSDNSSTTSVATTDVATQDNPGTRANPQDCYFIQHDESALNICKAALEENESPSDIKISSLKQDDLPPLNPGMTNVTKGPRRGYRFNPHGKKFNTDVEVLVPFDETRIPAGLSTQDIRTWYFDDELGRWVALEKVDVDQKDKKVKSKTDHFTDMINATLTMPEHPEAASFNPTQIKDIKAADPGAGINVIEPPQANNTGSANLSYPIEIPAGRSGMQPQLGVQYNSSGGNGWLGLGWDLSVPSISVETRWGVPRYDDEEETETYLLNGQQMTPLAHRGELKLRQTNKDDFKLKVEGSFQRIKRHGSTPSLYWWEVTDKNGVKNFYGGDGSNQVDDAVIGGLEGIFRWMLVKTVDPNGNSVEYEYTTVCDTGLGAGSCGSGVSGYQHYVSKIKYTGHASKAAPYSVEFIRDSQKPGYSRSYDASDYDPSTDRRRDVQIDARGGFKQVTAERLKDIIVKYNSEVVRSYELVYENGVFNKTLLKTIIQKGTDGSEFNRHEFDYFNEVPINSPTSYSVFTSPHSITTGNDNLYDRTFTGKKFNQTLIGGTFGRNAGYNGFFGIGFPLLGTILAGTGNYSANSSTSEGKVSLIDIDGDGQPDKVFLNGGTLKYRKNETVVGNETPVFSDEVYDVASTLGVMSRSSSDSSTVGFNGYAFGATGYRQKITTTNTDKSYFTDVNGDGLIDHVNNGRVKFGYRDITDPTNPAIRFANDSDETDNPINGGSMSLDEIFDGLDEAEAELRAQNPLLDAYRRWEAPYNGTIRIEGSVQLYDYSTDSDPDVVAARARYETADGVMVAIQKDGAEYWRARITQDDHTAYSYNELTNITASPQSLNSISVSRGDHIYFRVLSVDDGSYDQVNWSPRVVYIDGSSQAKNFKDVNNLNVYRYDTSEDTIFAGIPVTIPAPYDGDIHFTGKFTKPVTTDDITISIEIYEFNESTETFSTTPKSGVGGSYTQTLAWDDTGEFDLIADFKVETDDKIIFNFKIDSQIDMRAIQWVTTPEMYYTYAKQQSVDLLQPPEPDPDTLPLPEDQELPDDNSDLAEVDPSEMEPAGTLDAIEIPVLDDDGNYAIQLPVRYNADIYSADDLDGQPQTPWIAEHDGYLLVTPWLAVKTQDDLCEHENYYWWYSRCSSIEPTPDGDVTFTIKRRGELAYKKVMEVRNEQVVASKNGYEALAIIPVKAGEELFFDFTSRDDDLVPRIRHAQVKFEYGSRTPWTVPLTDTVTVATRTHASDNRDDDDYTGPTNPSTAVVLIRRDGEILDIRKVEVSAGGFRRIDENFTINVTEADRIYFDFFTADNSLSLGDSSAWTRYQGASPWIVPRAGKVSFDPVLSYKPNTIPNGNLTLKVFRNNALMGERQYKVENGNIIKAVDSIHVPYPLTIDVNKGDQVRYELWTNTHLLSSTFADKGRVSIDYVDTASWIVPSNWYMPDTSISHVEIDVKPSLVFDFGTATPDGDVIFKVKSGANILAEQTYTVKKGRLTTPISTINLEVNRSQNLEFIYTHDSGVLLPYLVSHDVNVNFLGQDYPVPSVFNGLDIINPISSLHILMPRKEQTLPLQESVLHFPEWNILYGNPYRGWAQAAFLSLENRADSAMDENLLKLSENRADYNNSYDTDVYPAMPTFYESKWDSIDGAWAIGEDYITATRRGLKYIDIPKKENFVRDPNSGQTAGIVRVPRFSYSKGYSDGGGFILTYSTTRTTTDGRIDLMDLNGDRYPDIISGSGVQYTLPNGSMASFDEGVGVGAVRLTRSSDKSLAYGGGTEPPAGGRAKMLAANDKPITAQKVSPPISVGGSFGEGESDGIIDYIDMNGDGLLDRVTVSGSTVSVGLNIGYSFATAETWGSGFVNKGKTKNFAFNFGWSVPGSIFSGGVNLNLGSNDVAYRLMDMNGDGLTDYVYANSSGIMVSLNYGGSLGTPILWGQSLKTLDDLSGLGPLAGAVDAVDPRYSLSDGLSSSVSVSGSAASTFTIWATFVPILDLVYGGGANYGETVSQPSVGFNDINGDGFIDSIRSGNDSKLEVSLSQIGRTNLLKGVRRPLGSSFKINYERTGNTYEIPQSMWVMNQVSLFDGLAADSSGSSTSQGGDYQVFKYTYDNGLHDRYEREFLGFAKVNQHHLDTRGEYAPLSGDVLSDTIQSKLYDLDTYRETLQTYRNESVYTKDLLKTSINRGLDEFTNQIVNYTKTTNKYGLRIQETHTEIIDLDTDSSQQRIANLSPAAVTVFPALLSTEIEHYEGQSSPGITTQKEFDYDEYGSMDSIRDLANKQVTDDDVEAIIGYTKCTDNHIRKANSIVVKGYKGYVTEREVGNSRKWGTVRERTGQISCSTGNLDSITQVIDSRSATTRLYYEDNGNLKSVVYPDDQNGDNYVLDYKYDDDVAIHIKEVTNDYFGYKSTVTIDPKFGTPLCSSDINDNQIRYEFDKFGRTKRIIGPLELGDDYKATCPGSAAGFSVASESIYTILFEYNPYVAINDAQHDSWARTQHYDKDAYGASKGNPIETLLFIDGMSRIIQTKKDATVTESAGATPNDMMIVSGRVIYDAFSRRIEQYYPTTEVKADNESFSETFDIQKPTKVSFDALDRILDTTLPDNSTSKQRYNLGNDRDGIKQFHTQITDAKGYIKDNYTDARQLITSIRESVNTRDIDGKISGEEVLWTSYKYDSMKQITDVIDAYDNTTQVDYDLLGRRILIDNPDTGVTQYVYDKAGNMLQKITAKASANKEAINYIYNNSRLTDIIYPIENHNVHYEYGSVSDKSKNQQGRIKEIRHSAGIEQREYGTLGETTREQFTVSAVRNGQVPSYATRYEFDTFGRLLNLQYPSGEVLIHEYDSGGKVSKISGKFQDEDYDYLKQLHYDKFEQRVYMALGNGAETHYTYNNDDRRLHNLQSISTVDGQFQNINYKYDDIGNITNLVNDVAIPRQALIGGPTNQSFDYDELHRLVSATGKFRPRQNQEHNYSFNMVYDGIHNIKQKRQEHTFGKPGQAGKIRRATTYDWKYSHNESNELSIRPHAPVSIDTRDFHYDANGNQTGWDSTVSGQRRRIIWDDENRIREINDPGNTAWYAYDDQGQRKIKRGRYGETVYVNQFLTVRDGALATIHVYAGKARVVSKLKPGKPIGRNFNTSNNNTTTTSSANSNGGSTSSSTSSSTGTNVRASNNGNGNSNASGNRNNNNNNGNGNAYANGHSDGHPGQGLEHRSDGANEVAQNTEKNPHLLDSGDDDSGGDNGDGDTGDDGSGGGLADIAYDFTGGAEFLYYYHPDHLGSTGYVTDKDGELYEHIEYFPFGETWIQEGTSNWKVPYMYTSKELDEDTQLYYYGARYYDPRTSVWQSADPILAMYIQGDGNGGVYNPRNLGLYTYAYNSPLIYSDPDGNIPVDTIWDALSIIYDAGKIGVGYATNNPKLITEGSIDLAADTVALFIPYVPAGATKIARLGGKAVSEAIQNRKTLRTILNTVEGFEAHHLIPVNILKKNKFAQKAVEGGLDFNGAMNGINLKKFSKKAGEGTHGNHPKYDEVVQMQIEKAFKGKNIDDMSPTDIKGVFENTVIPQLRGLAEQANKSNTNLNELSKEVLKVME